MNRTQLYDLHSELCGKGLEIMKRKNQDYADSSDPFQNFKMSEALNVPSEVGILIRIGDKMQRINSYVTKGSLAVKDESVEDSIVDAINYLVLLRGMMLSKRKSDYDIDFSKPNEFMLNCDEETKQRLRKIPSMGPLAPRIIKEYQDTNP